MQKKLRNDKGTLNRSETYGNIELRRKDGDLDEVVMLDENGRCIFHSEEMSDGHFSLIFYGTKKTVYIDFHSETKIKCKVRSIVDK